MRAVDRAGAHLLPGKKHHQFDQPRRRRGEIRARLPAGPLLRRRARLSAASTKTRCRRRPSRANANSKSPSVRTSCSRGNSASTPKNIIFDPLVFPCATGDENYIGGAVETIEGIRLIKQSDSLRAHRARHLQRLVRPARRRARGRQFRLPLPLHESRARPRHRQRGTHRALMRRFRRRNASSPKASCSTASRIVPDDHPQAALLRGAPADWREQTPRTESRDQPVSHRRDHRAFPRRRAAQKERARRTCRSISASPITFSKARRKASSTT